MVKCDNYLCLYWQKDKNNEGICIADSVELDNAGVCKSCIYFVDESKELDELRANALKKEKINNFFRHFARKIVKKCNFYKIPP